MRLRHQLPTFENPTQASLEWGTPTADNSAVSYFFWLSIFWPIFSSSTMPPAPCFSALAFFVASVLSTQSFADLMSAVRAEASSHS